MIVSALMLSPSAEVTELTLRPARPIEGWRRLRDLGQALRSHSATPVAALPAARALNRPRHRLPAVHDPNSAVASQLARSKIPVRTIVQASKAELGKSHGS